jgi:hypothetical protein
LDKVDGLDLFSVQGTAIRPGSLLQWHFVPRGHFDGVQMVERSQRLQFVQAGNHPAILNIRETAELQK